MNTTRYVVLDTETTGLSLRRPAHTGHRIVEIGAVEILNRKITQNKFQVYLNPGRPVDAQAVIVHGITDEFLADKPPFSAIIESFLAFLQDSPLVIHNASFDIGFLNQELILANRTECMLDKHHEVIDTLAIARQQFPRKKNSLDALCQRYHVDREHRTLHGALLDALLLAQVFLAMTGGQTSLSFDGKRLHSQPLSQAEDLKVTPQITSGPTYRLIYPTEQEQREHLAWLAAQGQPLWPSVPATLENNLHAPSQITS